MNIGFSCGDFYRLQSGRYDRFSDDSIHHFAIAGARAIELMCHRIDHVAYAVHDTQKSIAQFSHISIHAPAVDYDDTKQTHDLLQKMAQLCAKYSVTHVVFHPDAISSWDVIGRYDIPVAIENMDDRKKSFKTYDDIKELLNNHAFGLVIDLQHCFVNDPTMQLAVQLHENFFDRIVGYHISGYDPELLHVPLYKTDPGCIIDHVKKKTVPIIIESTFDAYEEAQCEMDYIAARLA